MEENRDESSQKKDIPDEKEENERKEEEYAYSDEGAEEISLDDPPKESLPTRSESIPSSSESIPTSSDTVVHDEKVDDNTNIRKEKELESVNPHIVYATQWLQKKGWSRNPFTFSINPSIFVGYEYEKKKLLRFIEEGHKIILVAGPTGSGKTSMLKWVQKSVVGVRFVFLGKPPAMPENFIDIFNHEFKLPWYKRIFRSKIKTLYEIPDFLNKNLKGKQLVILCDEIHESDIKVLEWLRVLSDHIENVTVILSGLPVFETYLDGLETFRKRIVDKIELLSLTKEEMKNLIRLRLNYIGGDEREFDEVMDLVYERTDGFPREVLRTCNSIVNQAIEKNEVLILPNLLTFNVKKDVNTSKDVLENITPMQKRVLELLKNPLTPGQVADMMDLGKYKSRQHAVRSVNNILTGLMKDELVERTKEDKAYIYHLSPKVKTLFVKA
ncbi:ATPase, T2SS/T4P/T4SS family [Candidatus Aenigmatarchaeota archaeon]